MPLVAIEDDAGRQIMIDPLTGQFQTSNYEEPEVDEGDVEGGTTTGLPSGFTPKGRIDGTFKVPGGTVVQYFGGIPADFIPDKPSSGGSLSPNTVYTQQQIAERDAAERAQQTTQQQGALAEQQRQFNENFGANKAQFNIEQQFAQQKQADTLAEAQRTRDFQRDQTLLQLGSRPETLHRYLLALRGQQAPQAAAPTPTASSPTASSVTQPVAAAPSALPVAPTNVTSPVAARPALPAATPATAGAIYTDRGWMNPGSGTTGATPVSNPSGVFEALPATDPRSPNYGKTATAAATPLIEPRPAPAITSQVNPAHLSPTLQPAASSVQFAPSGTQFASGATDENDALNQIRSREQYNAYQRSIGGTEAAALKYDPSLGRLYGNGGVIPEMVVGMGVDSGQQYVFGEEGREVVVPEKKVPKDIFERLMQDAEEVDYSEDKTGKRHVKVKRGVNSYAEGGMLGYKPIDPKVFNPPSISNEFGFGQIGNFTGGTSLVPSAQRLFDALPSERALYAGYLQDEVGVQSDDVFEMARRLAPQSDPRAGRFVN